MVDQPTPLEFLEAVYLNDDLPLTVRMRAATEAAKYRHAQLRAVAMTTMDSNNFAQALERCLARSQGARLALPAPTQHPASEMKAPFAMRRRNLR
jgi:hypothetical protein